MIEDEKPTTIWSRRTAPQRGDFWKFECNLMQKFSEKRKAKYEKAEPGVLFVISTDRPSKNYFKGPRKGAVGKSRPCNHCAREYSVNMKICPNCFKQF